MKRLLSFYLHEEWSHRQTIVVAIVFACLVWVMVNAQGVPVG